MPAHSNPMTTTPSKALSAEELAKLTAEERSIVANARGRMMFPPDGDLVRLIAIIDRLATSPAGTEGAPTKDWCMNMAALEGDQEIGAGSESLLHHALKAPAALPKEVERFMDALPAAQKGHQWLVDLAQAAPPPHDVQFRDLCGELGTGPASDDRTHSLWIDGKLVAAYSLFRDRSNFTVLARYDIRTRAATGMVDEERLAEWVRDNAYDHLNSAQSFAKALLTSGLVKPLPTEEEIDAVVTEAFAKGEGGLVDSVSMVEALLRLMQGER